MVKAVSDHSDTYQKGYQQALEDFGITELRTHLSNYLDADFDAALMNLEEQELESLAAVLIQRFTQTLKGKLIASYLNTIRHGDSQVLCDPINLEISPPSMDLPANFPNGVTPRYAEGDRVRWRPLADNTDWGVVIGHFYTYAPHQGNWAICYLIWLEKDSPSAAWTVADTAWEEDLEPSGDNGWEGSADRERTLATLNPNQHANYPITLSPYSLISKSLHLPPGTYDSGETNPTNPRTLTQREQNLIELYSNCQLGMTPQRFYRKWSVNYDRLASICDRSISTVRRWFTRGRNYSRPSRTDLRHLALMDFLLEHFEEIPEPLFNMLCPPNQRQ